MKRNKTCIGDNPTTDIVVVGSDDNISDVVGKVSDVCGQEFIGDKVKFHVANEVRNMGDSVGCNTVSVVVDNEVVVKRPIVPRNRPKKQVVIVDDVEKPFEQAMSPSNFTKFISSLTDK